MKPLTILSVAYPFAPVREDTAGGAEQVLLALDRALTEAGHESLVIASSGSEVSGKLFETPRPDGPIDNLSRCKLWEYYRLAVMHVLDTCPVDLVHMHGLDFDAYLPPPGIPVLVTLHLPLQWYAGGALRPDRPDTHLHCVSESQRKAFPDGMDFLPEIENGVPVERLRAGVSRRGFTLAMGRVCPEKGFHIALDSSKKAGVPCILAGQVFPYPEHESYFDLEIVPRLNIRSRFIGALDFTRKRRFLSAAGCLLVPSLVPETGCRVAMEALACGTPVIAYPAGAVAKMIEDGRTGFLVRSEEEMAEAIRTAGFIDPDACRRTARERFDERTMIEKYFGLYRQLAV